MKKAENNNNKQVELIWNRWNKAVTQSSFDADSDGIKKRCCDSGGCRGGDDNGGGAGKWYQIQFTGWGISFCITYGLCYPSG